MMPSTSDQIHSSCASSTDATIDAEKSDPPRPSVVARPSTVAPLNPVRIGMTPAFEQRNQLLGCLLARQSISGVALPNSAVRDNDLRRVDGRRRTPIAFR